MRGNSELLKVEMNRHRSNIAFASSRSSIQIRSAIVHRDPAIALASYRHADISIRSDGRHRAGDQGRDRAPSEEEAQATIRQMGYFVTKISVKKARKAAAARRKGQEAKRFAIGGVKSKVLTTFTRQLSILQDAGLPILRSLRILEGQQKPGRLKNSLIDVCDDIEVGLDLVRGDGQEPQGLRPAVRQHDQGRRGGRCAGSHSPPPGRVPGKSRSRSKRKVKGALVYPVVVICVAVGILTFIMYKIVPAFVKIFDDFEPNCRP